MYPINRPEDVDRFVSQFHLNPKFTFKWQLSKDFKGKRPNTPFPVPAEGLSIKDALKHFIDLQGPISKKLLKEMETHCHSVKDREKIESWTKLGSKTFDSDVIKKHIGVLDILTVLPSLKLS